MLFNSFPFLAGFLPLALAGLYFARRWGGQSGALAWIIGISLIFYSWWMPIFACLLIASVLANFLLSKRIEKDSQLPRVRKTWLILGITGNLIILAYFKYAGWLLQTFHMFPTVADNLRDLSLPLGISFFTFQQIAFLIDTYRGQTRTYTFPHYCFFVTFFPQLIAGPIARHHQILPQLANKISLTLRSRYFAIGITLFLIGLFKKVILADSIAKYPARVFSAADSGIVLTWFEAWGGTILYTFQLYYDFSGYSDMALGLGLLFGIRLPINFNSPYKAVNIADFWRRWHISLSLFFRDYVYIPLGGNRVSTRRGFTNVLFTMLLIGLWHGAGWTFLLWGLFHAALLIIYRIWQMSYSTLGKGPPRATLGGRALARAVTFVAVMVGWMLFNANSVGVATDLAAIESVQDEVLLMSCSQCC